MINYATITKKLKSPFALFIYKKLFFFFLIVFVAMTLVFIIPRLMPVSPADLMMARILRRGTVSPQEALEMRELFVGWYGLDKSQIEQYGVFWARFLTMDFGPSFWRYPRSVNSMVLYALPWTMVLVVPVLFLGYFLGNYIGAKTAFHKGKLNTLVYTITLYLGNVPYYWFGLILIFVFGIWLRWFPLVGGYSQEWIRPVFSLGFLLDAAHHYILPFLSLLILTVGWWSVGMRAMTLYEKESDYIQYSRNIGFRESKLRKCAQRNAILPQFTGLPINFGALVGNTLIVEYVFGYPGLGTLMYNAAINVDFPLLQASFVFILLVVAGGNLMIDILYGFIDPRIRTGYVGG